MNEKCTDILKMVAHWNEKIAPIAVETVKRCAVINLIEKSNLIQFNAPDYPEYEESKRRIELVESSLIFAAHLTEATLQAENIPYDMDDEFRIILKEE